jgi:outer membrane protein
LDVSVGQQNVDQGKLLLLSAQGDLDSAYARLSEALGLGVIRRYRLDDATAASPPPDDFESLSGEMAANNPALAAAKHSREAAYKRADASGKAYLPTVSVLASAGYNPVDNPSQRVTPTYGAVGIGLSVPLFSGGLLEAQEAADRAKAQAADHAVDDLTNRMAGDLRAAFNDAQTSYRDIAVTSRLLGNAQKSLRLIQAGFEIGRNSIVDVSRTAGDASGHLQRRREVRISGASLSTPVRDGRTTAQPGDRRAGRDAIGADSSSGMSFQPIGSPT